MQKVVNLLITAGEWTTLEPAIDVGTSRAKAKSTAQMENHV